MDELTAQNPNSIQQMFGSIAAKYDLINSVLSLGIHHYWKKRLIDQSEAKTGDSILDCATGTGDLAFLFESKLKKTGKVIGTDFCEPMLKVAQEKARQKGSLVQFETADVLNLPYLDSQFAVASISFGIRNVKNPRQALTELGRVVKSGGRVLVLEFGQPRSRLLGPLYRFYATRILPKVGGWISGQPKAYSYLESSSARFPSGQEFLELAKSTHHFSKVRMIPFFTGIAYLYVLERR